MSTNPDLCGKVGTGGKPDKPRSGSHDQKGNKSASASGTGASTTQKPLKTVTSSSSASFATNLAGPSHAAPTSTFQGLTLHEFGAEENKAMDTDEPAPPWAAALMRQVCILQNQLVKTDEGRSDEEGAPEVPLWDDSPIEEIRREVKVLLKAFTEQITSARKGAMWHHEIRTYNAIQQALMTNPDPIKEVWFTIQQRLRNLWSGLMSEGGWGATGASAEAHSLLGTKPKPQSSGNNNYKFNKNSSSYRKRRRGGGSSSSYGYGSNQRILVLNAGGTAPAKAATAKTVQALDWGTLK